MQYYFILKRDPCVQRYRESCEECHGATDDDSSRCSIILVPRDSQDACSDVDSWPLSVAAADLGCYTTSLPFGSASVSLMTISLWHRRVNKQSGNERALLNTGISHKKGHNLVLSLWQSRYSRYCTCSR